VRRDPKEWKQWDNMLESTQEIVSEVWNGLPNLRISTVNEKSVRKLLADRLPKYRPTL